jgi:small subunit ribosomal protein S20
MPVTKTAERALRVSKRKKEVNDLLRKRLEIAIRKIKKSPTQKNLTDAISLIDRSAKRNLFHKNKAARLKSSLSKLIKTSPLKKMSASKKSKSK